MKSPIVFVASAMCMLLAACGGGGGGGGVVSTPPPPPAVTNATLTDLKASQSFTNNAASIEAVWDLATKTSVSGTAKRSDVTISYDHAAGSYTVSYDGRSQTFGQGDVQTTSPGDTIYKKSGTAGTDYLTLIKVPYAGTQPTTYVGMGAWQRNAVSGSTQNTNYAVFTYGLPTATGSVPRSGEAGYRVDAFGLVSAPGKEPRSFQGEGQLSIDFAAGVFSTETFLEEYRLVTGSSASGGGIKLTAAGHLSSSSNAFSGGALYGGWFGEAAGSVEGRFYGPGAEELGASFYGANAAGMSVAGSFTGQRDASLTAQNLTLTNLRNGQQFNVQFAGNSNGRLDWMNRETFSFSTNNSGLNSGQFTINDKTASSDPNFTAWRKTLSGQLGDQEVTLSLYKPGADNNQLALTYVSLGKWSAFVGGTQQPVPTELFFTYGFETPARLLAAKTGTASYSGVIYGNARADGPDTAYYAVTGTSAFQVDFGMQSYSGTLAMTGKQKDGESNVDFGSFAFASPLATYITTASLTRDGTPVGNLATRFFGPDGQEIGGSLSLNLPEGIADAWTVISGVTVAKRK
jgi:hypothetical protein